MCAYACVCACVHMSVGVCAHLPVCEHACMYICLGICVYVCTLQCVGACTVKCTYVCGHVSVHVYACMFVAGTRAVWLEHGLELGAGGLGNGDSSLVDIKTSCEIVSRNSALPSPAF